MAGDKIKNSPIKGQGGLPIFFVWRFKVDRQPESASVKLNQTGAQVAPPDLPAPTGRLVTNCIDH